MRYMLIMQAPESMSVGENAGPPPEEVFEAMGRYNTDLVKAGVLLAAEGLTDSAAAPGRHERQEVRSWTGRSPRPRSSSPGSRSSRSLKEEAISGPSGARSARA